MTSIGSRVAGPLGFQTGNKDVQAINRTNATVNAGALVLFDLSNSDADGDVSNNIFGDANSGFANFVNPTTASLQYGVFGVVTRGGANNALCEVRMQGRVSIASDNLSAGEGIGGANGSTTAVTVALNTKVLAIALAGSAGNLTDSLFDGIYGLGFRGV